MTTINLTLNDTTPVKITGLTEDKDYFIQGFYKVLGTENLIDSPFVLYKGEPSENQKGLRNNYFAITANADIYVKALNVPTYIVVEEC